MIIRSFLLGVALTAVSFAASLNSTAGLSLEYWDGMAYQNGSSVVITPHNLWQSPVGDASWISYENTGIDRQGPAVTPSASTARFKLYQPFFASTASLLNLQVWADDTTGVYLYDSANNLVTTFYAPQNTETTCANNPIGCLPDKGGVITNYAVAAGNYTLQFDVYQLGTSTDPALNPMGLLYTGSVDPASVPEPGTWAMIAGGLTLVFGSRRLRRQ